MSFLAGLYENISTSIAVSNTRKQVIIIFIGILLAVTLALIIFTDFLSFSGGGATDEPSSKVEAHVSLLTWPLLRLTEDPGYNGRHEGEETTKERVAKRNTQSADPTR
jgi:hypothetical protein